MEENKVRTSFIDKLVKAGGTSKIENYFNADKTISLV